MWRSCRSIERLGFSKPDPKGKRSMLQDVIPSEETFLDFCDRDSNWGPLLFLRPERSARINLGRTAAGALILGVPLGLFATIMLTLFANLMEQTAPSLPYFPIVLTIAYGVIGHGTLARSWNRRAARIERLARFS
jgi:hypothetical protein